MFCSFLCSKFATVKTLLQPPPHPACSLTAPLPPPLHPCPPIHRYKMTCEYTWPHHLMSSDREAVEMIVDQHGFKDDVSYGKTKLFVRTPRTLFTLEQERAALIPILVLFLQKVGAPSDLGCIHATALTSDWKCRPRGFYFRTCDRAADQTQTADCHFP